MKIEYLNGSLPGCYGTDGTSGVGGTSTSPPAGLLLLGPAGCSFWAGGGSAPAGLLGSAELLGATGLLGPAGLLGRGRTLGPGGAAGAGGAARTAELGGTVARESWPGKEK